MPCVADAAQTFHGGGGHGAGGHGAGGFGGGGHRSGGYRVGGAYHGGGYRQGGGYYGGGGYGYGGGYGGYYAGGCGPMQVVLGLCGPTATETGASFDTRGGRGNRRQSRRRRAITWLRLASKNELNLQGAIHEKTASCLRRNRRPFRFGLRFQRLCRVCGRFGIADRGRNAAHSGTSVRPAIISRKPRRTCERSSKPASLSLMVSTTRKNGILVR